MNKVIHRVLSHLEAPTPLDSGDISGDSTDFSSINGPLRAVKGTEKRDESHVGLTRHCGKSAFTMNKVIHHILSHLEAPTPLDRGDILVDLTDFSSINWPLRAVKGTEERDESHVDLTRHCGKFAVTMNKVLHRVYFTLKHPRRWIEVIFSMTRLTFPQLTGPCVRSKGLRSAMNRTITSPELSASSQ
jgi:hypothetical protein